MPFTAGADLIGSLTWAALALLYAGAVLAVWSLVTYLRGVWVHFRCLGLPRIPTWLEMGACC